MKFELLIDESRAGKRVFDLLRRELGLSNRMLTRLKQDEQGILVDGERVTVRYQLAAGSALLWRWTTGRRLRAFFR